MQHDQIKNFLIQEIVDKELTKITLDIQKLQESEVSNVQFITYRAWAESLKNALVESGLPMEYADFRVAYRVFMNADGKNGIEFNIHPDVYNYINGIKNQDEKPAWGDIEKRNTFLDGSLTLEHPKNPHHPSYNRI